MRTSHDTNPFISTFTLDTDFAAPRPESLTEWIEQLPLANIPKTLEMIRQTINHYLTSSPDHKTWFDVLEQLYTHANQISDATYHYYHAINQSPRNTLRNIMHVVIDMHDAIAQSYQQLAESTAQDITNDQKATAIHRALRQLHTIQLHCLQLYTNATPAYWNRLNALYSLARKNNLTKNTIIELQKNGQIESTIDAAFIAPCLLATASPNQLRPDDITEINAQLLDFAKVSTVSDIIEDDALFVIQLDGSQAPTYRKLIEETEVSSSWISLDIIKALTTVETSTIPENLKQHLIHSWGSFPTRQFPRTNTQGDVKVSIGLATTHYFLNEQDDIVPNHLKQTDTVEEQLSLLSLDNQYNPDLIEKIAQMTPTSEKHYRQHDWQLINASKNGYCLCTTATYPEDIHVGDMIGIREESENSETAMHIGIIRWLRYCDDDTLQVGIQLISPNAQAIGLRNMQQEENKGEFLRGLMLPEITALFQQASIVAPRLFYKSGDIVHIANHHLEKHVKLINAKNCGYQNSRFSYEDIHIET